MPRRFALFEDEKIHEAGLRENDYAVAGARFYHRP